MMPFTSYAWQSRIRCLRNSSSVWLSWHAILEDGATCLLWCVWKEKNNRCFEDLESFLEDILTYFLHILYLWTVAFVSPLSLSFSDFLIRFSLSS
jgi:hypothetical protein